MKGILSYLTCRIFLFIIKKINENISSSLIDYDNPKFKEILLTNLEHSHLYNISKANFFNLSNFYILENVLKNIENKEIKEFYLRYKDEEMSNSNYEAYFEEEGNMKKEKTLTFFEDPIEGLFFQLKNIINVQVLTEKIFFQVIF